MSYSNKPKALDSLLKDFMKRIPQRSEMKRGLVLHFWPDVVGEQVSKITKDVYFERDRLIVKVINDAWRHELHMNRYSIKKKLNAKVGSEVVKDVIVRC
jgi:predicted nucleic acid-binding Zn ribbon protein